ncbi:MAG TPA: SAM-dependent methyltransferase [Candidatus Onthousia faecipullorum]|uniref:SAM-dependent methyltransferase n=1 Tax=Candidatus Onthousia faecipullorum TaxID=2840887 RepID=A0A9D1KC82_9FIRM|nr:SAM-dependent methyltransferase [Candidatus Onthousia faecipullorum]
MKINTRLKTIGDLVPLSSYPLDIGCDHALLSIYLVKEKGLSKTVASDNKSGPLKKARENVNFYKVSDKVELIEAEGLDSYKEGIDTITISGMGGLNINKILDDNKRYLKNITTLILSPNNYSDAVKRKLLKLGYHIDNEVLVKEKNIIYQIFVFKRGRKYYSYKKLFLGPVLSKKKDTLTIEYYKNLLENKKALLKALPKSFRNKIKVTKKEIKYLEDIINN